MSDYYNPKRAWNLFDPKSKEPYRLSRSKMDLFVQCPRCFYFDLRLGVGRPPGFPLTLNNAVDALMKKEFDIHRAAKTTHPLMKQYAIDAVPLSHPKMEEWRDAFKRGISYLHTSTNLILRGGVDDIWVTPEGEFIIVDYKATSKDEKITLDDAWKVQYKRQMEIYQWLFEMNDFPVSKTGYFVYVNGKTDRKGLNGKLEFDVIIIPYEGKTHWVEGTLVQMKKCLVDPRIPKQSPDCDYCNYVSAVFGTLKEQAVQKPPKIENKMKDEVKTKTKETKKKKIAKV